MRLTPEQARALYGGKLKRAAVKDTKRLWPKGQVPYVIDKSLGKLLSIIAMKNQRGIARNKAI